MSKHLSFYLFSNEVNGQHVEALINKGLRASDDPESCAGGSVGTGGISMPES